MRILILEDDPLIALDLQLMLESLGHEIVEICNNISAARRMDKTIDFALLDVDLPDGKSFGLASSLEERRIPFAFVSGSIRADLPAHLSHAPFIAKPYQEAAIVNSLRAH